MKKIISFLAILAYSNFINAPLIVEAQKYEKIDKLKTTKNLIAFWDFKELEGVLS